MLKVNYPKDDWEWLIIDDGSTDNLNQVIEIFNKIAINIRTIHKENGGIQTAQNTAVMNAMGEYITRIDSDDAILPDTLTNQDL